MAPSLGSNVSSSPAAGAEESSVSRLNRLDACAVSDALDKLGLAGVVTGIHRLATERKIAGHTGSIRAVAFSPDGTQVLTGSDDRTARVWDAASGKPIATLSGHPGHVWAVAFSPDGTRVLTGSDDDTARV